MQRWANVDEQIGTDICDPSGVVIASRYRRITTGRTIDASRSPARHRVAVEAY